MVKQWCKPDNAGGQAPVGYPQAVKAVNNPNYSGAPSNAKRAMMGKLASVAMTKEESEEFLERAKQANVKRLTPRGSAPLHKRVSDRTSDPPLHVNFLTQSIDLMAKSRHLKERPQDRRPLPHERRRRLRLPATVVHHRGLQHIRHHLRRNGDEPL